MDDNELDKLFGEASAAAEEPSKEGASDSDAAEKDSGADIFVIKQYKEGSDGEEDEPDEDQSGDSGDSEGSDEEVAEEDESEENTLEQNVSSIQKEFSEKNDSLENASESKEIKRRSFFNKAKKKNVTMKYPLNNIEDCNYQHYTLQLSLYAYILQKLNPEFNIKELKLVHIARDGKQTVYDLEYRKADIERMLKHYAKSLKTNELLDRDKPYII